MSGSERRKSMRLGLAIPVRVQGFLADGSTWEEFSTTTDVSAGGASFPLSHDVELGQILYLSLALPKRLRQFDLHESSYRVYTLVRDVRRAEQPQVGVMFFGKYPPRGFHERPGARYLLPGDSAIGSLVPPELREGDQPSSPAPESEPAPPEAPAVPPPPAPSMPSEPFLPSDEAPDERRRHPRVNLFVNFTIQQVDEWGAVLQEELTVADNMSAGGARVMTTLSFQVGDVLLVQEAGGGFATRAEVRNITKGQTSERLHLKFLDRLAPPRLLRQ